MQDFNQNRKGRNLRKYCNDEGIDYKWLSEYKRTYGATKTASAAKNSATDGISFTALDVIESKMTPEDPRKEASVDLKNIVGLLQLRMFSKNNDRTRFLNGEFDFDERRGEELGFKGMMGELNTLVKSLSKEAACNGEAEEVDKPKLPKGKKKSAKKRRPGYKRDVFSVALSRSMDNATERTIRKLTTQRNNSLHYGSDAGVEMAVAYHSVISTVKLHGMSCWRYLGEFFKKIFNGCRDFFSLTPANIGMAYAKYRSNEYKASLLDLYRVQPIFIKIIVKSSV